MRSGPDAIPAESVRHLPDSGRRDHNSTSSSTLVLRKLDAGTTEETLYEVLGAYGQLHEIRLLRDPVTLASKGSAFVDFVAPTDASKLLAASRDQTGAREGLWIDNKHVLVNFAQDTRSMAPRGRGGGGMSSVAAQALAAASWGMKGPEQKAPIADPWKKDAPAAKTGAGPRPKPLRLAARCRARVVFVSTRSVVSDRRDCAAFRAQVRV